MKLKTKTTEIKQTKSKAGKDLWPKIPRGTIVAWNGDPKSPPDGWAVCDGKKGTPNLNGRFLRGIVLRDDDVRRRFGGSETHIHTELYHGNRPDGQGVSGLAPGSINSLGSTGSASNMPPYYTVVYIIKL